MMRRGFQAAATLSRLRALPGVPCILPRLNPILPRLNPAAAFGSSMDSRISRFCPEKTDFKDYALPNASWCPDMLSLYQEFLEKTKTDGWIKLPSFKSNREHIQGLKLPTGLAVTPDQSDCRIITRSIQEEGQGYEHVIFFNPSKKKSVCLFQPGPYLEGPPGSWVGGALDWKDIRVTWSSPVVKIRESLLTELGNFPVRDFRGRSERDVVNFEVDKIRNQEPGFQSCSATAGLGTPSWQFNLWLSVSLPKTGGKDIYLPERFAHGGSLATMMDETFSKTAYLAGEGLLTLSLSIRFKNLIPVGSLAVLNVNVDKIEDQKLYMSCITQTRDQQTVYAKSSGVFLQLQLEQE
ncbi:hypothetical protein QTO34_011208 [Cnephaeus nilssonii]|uniref:Thioesterase domain-containing protein n=1 Tax=Cnephaeus nilssonii TaxID=3371016 RepID=A0AA40HDW3_CNENI|nr:hypothetical protein QTO34_011208 [Eptesicus nilssonii]